MEYLKVKWQHHHPDEPVEIYSEIDSNRWEIRKVEVFRDGTTTYASPIHRTANTWLAEAPIPDLAEINSDSQFEGKLINGTDFERVWLMSSQMITLQEPYLVQTIQQVIEQKNLNINEFVMQAIEHYLAANAN